MRFAIKVLLTTGIGLAIAGGLALGVYAYSLLPELPDKAAIREIRLTEPLRIYAQTGELIAVYGDERRIPAHIAAVPPLLINAILAAEDNDFYHHRGVDLLGVARAALANLRSRGSEQGASTITMQVARNYFLSPEKTYRRKLTEMLLAFRLERLLTKNQILELYINKIFLGHRSYGFAAAANLYYGKTLDELTVPQMATLAGLPKAPSRDNPLTSPARAKARRSYVLHRMRQLNEISDRQLATYLAAPITARLHRIKIGLDAPYLAEMARRYMLRHYGDGVYNDGYRVTLTVHAADQVVARQALRAGLESYDRRHGYRGPAGHIAITPATALALLNKELDRYPGSGEYQPAVVIGLATDKISVYSAAQGTADIGRSGFVWARKYLSARRLGARVGPASDVASVGDVVYVRPGDSGHLELAQLPAISGALVSLNPASGAITALTGGFDFYLSKFNRALQARRQPGSNIKPFIYSGALEYGFTPATTVSAAPIAIADPTLGYWRPQNYGGTFSGPMPLRRALSLSVNLVSVRLVRAMGLPYTRTYLTRFGFPRDELPNGMSLALGSASLSPLQVVRGYAVFANGGYRVTPYFIERIEDRAGQIVEQHPAPRLCDDCDPAAAASDTDVAPRVISRDNAFLMTSMMQQVIRSGTGTAALKLKRDDLAGKTGTTNDQNDAWFSGFNPGVVTTVWVGFDHPTNLGRHESGARSALPIWIDYMGKVLAGTPEKPPVPPAGVVSAFVDRDTGQLTNAASPDGYTEYFIDGTQPTVSTAASEPAQRVPSLKKDLF